MQRTPLTLLIRRRTSRRQLPQRRNQTFLGGTARVLLAMSGLVLSAALILGGYLFASITHDLPSIEQLPAMLDRQNGDLLQPTRLLDRSGTQTLAVIENNGVTRKFLSVDPDQPDHFSLQLTRLIVADLQPDFWSSSGATPLTELNSQPRTIAERLVRSLLLASEPDTERTCLRMKILAAQITRRYGRSQVLEWYLNSMALGHNSFGSESASQLYLHTSAADLDLAQAALLVSLVNSPALNPADAPTAALENQQLLLKNLLTEKIISQDEYDSAAAEKLSFFGQGQKAPDQNSAFIQLALAQLNQELGSERVARGGLTVLTTLDSDLQTQYECSARSQLLLIQTASYGGVAGTDGNCPAANLLPTQSFDWLGNSNLRAGGLILDPHNGQVLAYLQPTSLTNEQPNDNYQIGSLATPFVALAAFARGTSPSSLLWDTPITLPGDVASALNPDGSFHGPVNVRSALANDYVAPFASLAEQISLSTVWSLADATGLSSPLKTAADASLLFGGGKVSLLEVAQGYATLAAQGNRNGVLNEITGNMDPVLVLQVRSPSGQILINNETSQSQAVLSNSLTYLINNVLSDQTARWTSLGHPNALEIGRTAAVKSGQVADKDQVWTVGYTPNRLVLTWMGEDVTDAASSPLDLRMSAGLWHAMIQYASQNFPDQTWSQPADVSTVQVCSPSGMLPTAICPTVTNDVFLNGNEPTQADTLYEKLSVNRETGLLATVFTPTDLIEDHIFLNVPANLRTWAIQSGLDVAPQGYDIIAAVQTNPDVQISSPSLFAPVSGKVEIRGTATGSDFASFSVQVGQGINPQSWQQIGSGNTSPVQDSTLAIWDTSGLNGLYAVRLNVVSANNQIQTAVIQVTVDNVPPSIQVTYPSEGNAITASGQVLPLNVSVSDQVGIASVEWWIDGKKAGTRSEPPFTYLWTPVVGKHTLQIKAVDTAGNLASTDVIHFEVTK